MKKIYNQKAVAVNQASVGSAGANTFTYRGFSSKNKKSGFKLYDIDKSKLGSKLCEIDKMTEWYK